MHAVSTSLLLPLRQITDPGFRWPLLKGVAGALLAFAGLVWLADWGVSALVGGDGWLATLAGLLGGVLVLVSAVWLFVPVMLGIASLFLDEVAEAVEKRFYPALPPPQGAGLHAQIWAGVVLGLRMLVLTVLVMILALFAPPVGAVLFWVVAAVSLGNGLFDGVAQRRMAVTDATLLRRRLRWPIWAVGGVLALAALVPVLNLVVPVWGTAAMTHLMQRAKPA
ncbi:CysZ-like family protein [Acetobacteraceae bacterium AT-5844]|nr:CysZ-like family protein [Acetobacteraceae bacterium AT-5844]